VTGFLRNLADRPDGVADAERDGEDGGNDGDESTEFERGLHVEAPK
jgi:hypothetical protein